jgi:ketosteroid isomerase-like protein
MTDDDQRTRNGAAFARSLAALSNGDLEGHLAGCSNDFLLELPYADPPVSVKGKEAVRSYLTPALATFSMRLDLTRLISCADPEFLIAEYTSDGHVTTTNKPYSNGYVSIVRFRGALICAQREYYNPVPAARALLAD